jgi:hypothetical protein
LGVILPSFNMYHIRLKYLYNLQSHVVQMSGRLKILDVMSVTSYSNMTKVFLERVKNQFYEKKLSVATMRIRKV